MKTVECCELRQVVGQQLESQRWEALVQAGFHFIEHSEEFADVWSTMEGALWPYIYLKEKEGLCFETMY